MNDMVKKIFISECKLVCEYLDAKITEIDFFDYYVHMIIESNPKYSANDIIQKIKSHTSKVIREKVVELNKLPSLWTREYLVTTESELEEGLINNFLEKQKKWGGYKDDIF